MLIDMVPKLDLRFLQKIEPIVLTPLVFRAYSNTPPPDARLEADGIATAEEPPALSETISSRTTRNYEFDRIVRHVKNPTGNIDRITVAVVINEKNSN